MLRATRGKAGRRTAPSDYFLDNDTYPRNSTQRVLWPAERAAAIAGRYVTVTNMVRLGWMLLEWSCPALPGDRGQPEAPVRHSQPVVDSDAATVVAAATGACREAGSCDNGHSQMAVEKWPNPECSQIVAEHSQEVVDRTIKRRSARGPLGEPQAHQSTDKLHYVRLDRGRCAVPHQRGASHRS